MIELEVYAAGVRELDKIMQLDHLFEAMPGMRYKIDSNHDIVYMEFDDAAMNMTSASIRDAFQRIGLKPRFVGTIPSELRQKSKTQRLRV